MLISITNITPQFPNAVYIQWDFTPDAGVVGTFLFTVQRSGNPTGPWTDVIVDMPNSVNFTDTFDSLDSTTTSEEINLLSVQRSLYYRVIVTDPNIVSATSIPVDLNGEIASDPKQNDEVSAIDVVMNKRKFLLRRKIIRDETVALKNLNGIKFSVLKKRHFGQRCTVCYDKLTRANVLAKCPTCFGTSWVGGYFEPIVTYGRLAPSPVQVSNENTGKSEVNGTQLMLLNYPKVEEGDIVVEMSSRQRWVIKAVAPTELKRLTVHQRITVIELPGSSPEYAVGV